MKLVVLYQPHTEFARITEEYVQEFKGLHPEAEVALVDVDSIEGSKQAQLYDVVQYPALLAIANNGSLLNMWSGSLMPLMDEVMGYLRR
jgi:hypothetical protein